MYAILLSRRVTAPPYVIVCYGLPGNVVGDPDLGKPAPRYSRVGMMDSPDPLRSDAAEVRLAPGAYVFTFRGNVGLSQCEIRTAVRLEPTRQYEFAFGFESARCVVRSQRWNDASSGWAPFALSADTPCPRLL